MSSETQQYDDLPEALITELRRLDHQAHAGLKVPAAVDQAVLREARTRIAWRQRFQILRYIGAAAGGILATAALLVLAMRPMTLNQHNAGSGGTRPHFLSVQPENDHSQNRDGESINDRPHAKSLSK